MTDVPAGAAQPDALEAIRTAQAAFYRLAAFRHVEIRGIHVHFDHCAESGCKAANAFWSEAEIAVELLRARLDAAEAALWCFHDEDRMTYVQHEGETWNLCPDCGLIELWAGGQRFKQKVLARAAVEAYDAEARP